MSAAELMPLDSDEPDVLIRPLMTINHAIDAYAGDLSRRGCSDRTRYTYTRILGLFADRIPEGIDVTRITSDDCRRFLDGYNRRADGTKCHTYTVLSSFFKWLVMTEQTKRSPMTTIPRPRRRRAEDLDVVSVSGDDVRRLLKAGQTWTERLAVAIPVYCGPRRRAVAQLRLADYDRARGRLRFQEKGGKTIWKPVPDELANLLEAAISDGAIVEPDDYLVPPEGHLSRAGVRDDRVIWRVVKRVAERAGVETHVHALRAAFAVLYLEQNPGDTYGAQQLLGHVNPQTTQVYLRKLDKDTVMEPVRGLSWEIEPMMGGSDVPLSETQATDAGAVVRRDSGAHEGARLAGGRSDGRADRGGLPEVVGGGSGCEHDDGRGGRADEPCADGDVARDSAVAEAAPGSEIARLRREMTDLESRLATAEAARQRLEASAVVGAGGFEPPQSVISGPVRAGGTDLVGVLGEEARLASSEATREEIA